MRNNRLRTLGACCILIMFNMNCGSDFAELTKETVTVEFELDPIDALYLDQRAEVYLQQGDVQRIKVTASQEIIDKLNRTVIDGEWEIDVTTSTEGNNPTPVFEITLPNLKSIINDSSGDIIGKGTFTSDEELFLKIDGSGDFSINVNTPTLTVISDGSGDFDLQGEADVSDIVLDGSGKIDAYDLRIKKATLLSEGSGKCKVRIDEHLDVKIKRSGDVYYKGQATIESTVTGSGELVNDN